MWLAGLKQHLNLRQISRRRIVSRVFGRELDMKTIKIFVTITFALAFLLTDAIGQAPAARLLPDFVISALAAEISGETAKTNLEFISRNHRMRGSREFRASAEFIAEKARAYGLQDVNILQFAADGKTFYGTQKARPAWDADFAELWEMGTRDGAVKPLERIASWEAVPLTLAQDSESADVTAELVDVGSGTSESDYQGRDVRGKIVLVAAQPGAVARLAVERFGASGILSYAQNQPNAWWGDNDNLIRWGHLDSFSPINTFAFMLTLKQARGFQARLARGERIMLRAEVRAGRKAGNYDIVTAVIPGTDPRLREEEIAFSCHLDHPHPGANDNASGCVAILEVARTYSKLIREGKIKPPLRTIRFVWPPEIEGTLTLLNARPDITKRLKAVIHMDMVGGSPETKAVFHVTRGPASLPSFIYDTADEFGAFVNEQSYLFASGEKPPYPLTSPEGGKEPLLAMLSAFDMGSDHQVYSDSSFGIPGTYLNDWPDRYIHTNSDIPANIDPTKLKRAGFIGAAQAYFLANLTEAGAVPLLQLLKAGSLRRTADVIKRSSQLEPEEAANLLTFHFQYERDVIDSIEGFFPFPRQLRTDAMDFIATQERLISAAQPGRQGRSGGGKVYHRNPAIKGPMTAFGYSYLTDHYGEEKTSKLGILRFQGIRGSGSEYAYEVLNFVDGVRDTKAIRNAVSAVYGPIPLPMVEEYLAALESINVIQK